MHTSHTYLLKDPCPLCDMNHMFLAIQNHIYQQCKLVTRAMVEASQAARGPVCRKIKNSNTQKSNVHWLKAWQKMQKQQRCLQQSDLGKLCSIALGPVFGICTLDDSLHVHDLSVDFQLSQWHLGLAWLSCCFAHAYILHHTVNILSLSLVARLHNDKNDPTCSWRQDPAWHAQKLQHVRIVH